MFGLSKPRLPRLTVIGRAMLSGVVVVALLTEGTGIVAGLSSLPAVASASSVYVPLTPTRVLDTRIGNGLPGRLLANTPATFQVAGRSGSGIASDATAVTGNVTVVDPTNSWAVYLGPDPQVHPTTSTINFTSGQVVGNGLIVALSTTGSLSATYMSTAGNTTDLVFDVTGYFVAGAGAQGPAGPQGPKGDTGAAGPQGATGATGATGAQGPKGDKGDTGATGAAGAQGPKGDTGATGAAGANGTNGTNGTDGNTVLYGTGAPGAGVGVAGNFYIDTDTNTIYGPKTTTWPPGTNLVGPQGPEGETGAKGDKGDAGAQGATGAAGAQGPKGDAGAQGATGAAGAQGPKGDTGATGATGPQGPSGVLGTGAFSGSIGFIAGGASAWWFVGPTTMVATTADYPRLTGSAVAILGSTNDVSGQLFDYSICIQQNGGGSISPMGLYLQGTVWPDQRPFAISQSWPVSPGQWMIGFCVLNAYGNPMNNNGAVSGWVQVTNL